MKETYLKVIGKFYDFLTTLGVERGHDKILHFLAGVVITFIAMMVLPKLLAVIVGMSAGPIKESFDWYFSGRDNSKFSFFDMFATMVGSFAGIVVYSLTFWIFGLLGLFV